MPVIAFANMKGGVGKTILAYILAVDSVRWLGKNAKVLAIDLDPQANLTNKLLTRDALDAVSDIGIHRFFSGELPLRSCTIRSKFKHITVSPSFIGLGVVEHKLLTSVTGTYTLKYNLDKIKDEYDLVILDCPPNLGIFALNGIVAADASICPLSPDSSALAGWKYLLEVVKNIPEPKKIGLIVNLVDRRVSQHKTFIEMAKNAFSHVCTVLRPISRRAVFQRAFEVSSDPYTEAHGIKDVEAMKDIDSFVTSVLSMLEMPIQSEETTAVTAESENHE